LFQKLDKNIFSIKQWRYKCTLRTARDDMTVNEKQSVALSLKGANNLLVSYTG